MSENFIVRDLIEIKEKGHLYLYLVLGLILITGMVLSRILMLLRTIAGYIHHLLYVKARQGPGPLILCSYLFSIILKLAILGTLGINFYFGYKSFEKQINIIFRGI